MKQELIDLLEGEFEFPVFLQGSLAGMDYPPAFFTFWNNETPGDAFYDNDASVFVWDFSINFYANDPSLVASVIPEVRTLLKSNGWTVSGLGYDVPSDEPTHTGRGITALYIQKNQEE